MRKPIKIALTLLDVYIVMGQLHFDFFSDKKSLVKLNSHFLWAFLNSIWMNILPSPIHSFH